MKRLKNSGWEEFNKVDANFRKWLAENNLPQDDPSLFAVWCRSLPVCKLNTKDFIENFASALMGEDK